MPELAELDQLLKALAQGDRSAFTPVFQRLWPSIHRLCVRLMESESEGQDAAQSSMLKILERANEYDWKRPALPWAVGIATWECRTQRKKRARLRESAEAPADAAQADAVEEREQQQLLDAAVQAMGTLSAVDQEALVATYWETAAAVSGATLRKRRERALTRLRDAFRRLYGLD